MTAFRLSRRTLLSSGLAAAAGVGLGGAGAAQADLLGLSRLIGCQNGCGLSGAIDGPLRPADLAVVRAALRAQQAMGYHAPVEIRAAATATAGAVLIPHPQQQGRMRRLVVYSPDYLHRLRRWGGDAALIGLLAHEIAHHANNDLGPDARRRGPLARELDADFVAGYALAKLGFSAENSTHAFRFAYAARPSATHPDTGARVRSVLSGWRSGRAALG